MLSAPLGNQSQSICWETLSPWRSGGHPPSCQCNPSGAVSCSSRPEPGRFPARSTALPSLQPRSRGGCLPRSGLRQLLQEGFDLHCLVWLFKYCSECWGNVRHVYPLLWERFKTHVSSYSPAGLSCSCFHVQCTRTHPAVYQDLGCAVAKQTGEGEESREERSTLGRIPHSSSRCALLGSPTRILPRHLNLRGSAEQGALCRSCLKKDLLWKNCPAETFHTKTAVSSFLLIPSTQTGK